MKINDILQNQNVPGRHKVTGSGGVDFAEVLKSHLAGPERTAPTAGPGALGQTLAPTPAHLRIEGLGLSENTISTLDSFSAALGNTALKAEELEPYISALENDLTAMQALRRELPEQDPLSRLLDQVAAVSHLEAAKYRRGDYN
ncbi:MAG: hypothetical protein ACNA74_06485 [Desulfurivibrio sp.]